jgi:hypothetical protein
VADLGEAFHPEKLVRCGMLELARSASLGSSTLHVVAHRQLKVSYCRRWGLQTLCTGRGDCYSLDNVTAYGGPLQGQVDSRSCPSITYHPMQPPPV